MASIGLDLEPQKAEHQTDPRIPIIIQMKRQYANNSEIARALKITRQRVCQIIKDEIIPEFGESILFPTPSDKRFFTVEDAVNVTGQTRWFIFGLVKRGKILVEKHGRRFFISEEEMEKLKDYLANGDEGICRICEERFNFIHKRGRRPGVCHKTACIKRYDRQRQLARYGKDPSSLKLTNWHKTLWGRLKTHPRPETEIWITHSEALYVSELTQMQIGYLRNIGIIKTKPCLGRNRRRKSKKQCNLYSFHDVKLAGQVYRDWQSNGKP